MNNVESLKSVMQFAKKNDDITEVLIYGEIRKQSFWEIIFDEDDPTRVGAYDFAEALSKVETPKLNVRINSMGGSVSEGLSIYNLLKGFDGEVTTVVDGFACSAASVIFMAGKKRVVPESGLLMIHNAWSSAQGDHNAMRKAADDLEKITQPSVNIYVSNTGLEESKVKEMMDNEEWITSSEAYNMGFATTLEKVEPQQSLSDLYLKKIITENKELKMQLLKTNNSDKSETLTGKSSKWDGFF